MKWNRGQTIGHGSSATVSLATFNGDIFAVKSSELSHSESLKREQRILSSLCYPNPYVVTYKGFDITLENNKHMYNLFMEYMPFGTLAQAGGRLDEPAITCYIRQVVKGLEYLHSHGLVHSDIKGANILINENGAKIGDFGCAKSVAETAAVIRGTPMFMAPEVARGEEQGCASDIWSLGCTVIEMVTGAAPWPIVKDPISVLYHIVYSNEVPEIPCFLSNEAKDFLEKCLRRNPEERWTASQLLKHSFIEELCSNGKQVVEVSSSSPTSILEQGFWGCVEESEILSIGNLIIEETCFHNSYVDRVRRLAACSGEPYWAWHDDDDDDDDSWMTIRGNEEVGEVNDFGNSGSENGSTSTHWLVKNNVKKDRISRHFCHDDIHIICTDSSVVTCT